MVRFDVVTLFPELITGAVRFGITGRALERGLWSLGCWNPRDFACDAHRTVDDRPYGGGPGMVMIPGPLEAAVAAGRQAQKEACGEAGEVIYLSPRGTPLDHRLVMDLAGRRAVTLVAGRYEGIDERVVERMVDREVSLGDYVLSGGEFAALVVIDAVVRQLPGATNDAESVRQESFAQRWLDTAQYTRPEVYEGHAVPAVLMSGNHAAIARWRRRQSLGVTFDRRPDLLGPLAPEDRALLDEYVAERVPARPKARDRLDFLEGEKNGEPDSDTRAGRDHPPGAEDSDLCPR